MDSRTPESLSAAAGDTSDDGLQARRANEPHALLADAAPFQLLVEASPNAIVVVGPDGGILMANAQAVALFGYTHDELLAGTVEMLVPAAIRDQHVRDRARFQQRPARRAMGAGRDLVARRKDGSEVPVEIGLTPLDTAEGPCVMATVTDITARRSALSAQMRAEGALRDSEARFRLALKNAPVAVAAQDRDLRYVWAYNQRTPTPEQMIGQGDQALYAPDEAAHLTVVKRRVLDEGIELREQMWLTGPGGRIFLDLYCEPVRDAQGAVIGVASASVDLTPRKLSEDALRESEQQKDDFIAVLAHELRNPLAPIRTAVGVLRSMGGAHPMLLRIREVIDRQVAQMARLLDDLLDVSRLSRGKLSLQRHAVRLCDVVEDAVETARPAIDGKRHALRIDVVDPAIVLDADGARLTQVFANLLNNAAKYTNAGGHIALAVDDAGERVRITVSDDGVGIAPEQHERVFELFTQAHDVRHRADGGLGIGLALTRRLVEMHGGTIAVASEGEGRGSAFTVELPILPIRHRADAPPAAAQPPTLAPPPTPAPGGSRDRVLIVDDNVDAADTLALLLSALGCDTRAVYDGATALREARAFRPNLLLLDLGMPELDGLSVCRRLRAQPWGEAITVAAITGWGQEEDLRRTRAAGFDHHLVKPVDADVLAELVRGLRPA